MFLVYFERLDPGSLTCKHRDILGFFRIFAIFLVLINICWVKGQNTGSAQQKLQNIV